MFMSRGGFQLQFTIAICLCGIFFGCSPKDDEEATKDPVQTTNMSSSVPLAEPVVQPETLVPQVSNRLTKYQSAFTMMDREKFKNLVVLSPDELTKYQNFQDESPEYDQLLDVLDAVSQAAFHEAPLDWKVDFSKFPDLEVEHWKFVQHASLVVQWWVHKFILEGDVDTAYQILQIGLKLADDVILDKTLPGVLLAMQIRDELCQVIIDEFHAVSPEQAGLLIEHLMPHILSGKSWVAENYSAAVVEMEWFISKTKELQQYKLSTNGTPNFDLLPKDYLMGFYALKGYVDPVDQAILKGVPASELEKDPARSFEIISGIQLEVGQDYALEFLSKSPQEVDEYFNEIRGLHVRLGEVIALNSWDNYLEGVTDISRILQNKIFLWNHSLAWIKARKMEYLSRLKFSLLLNGLINHSGQIKYLPKAVNPISGSIPKISPHAPDEIEVGFFVFVDGLPRSTNAAFSPFHQILFMTKPTPKYYGYGLRIGHPVE